EKLYVDKRGEDFQVIVDKPFWVMEPRVHAVPMRFDLNGMLRGKFDQHAHSWKLNPLKLSWDEMPVELVAEGDFSGGLDAKLSIEPGTLEKTKQYLPYGLMSDKLQSWLKSALVSGEEVKGDLFFKGDLNDYPFTEGETSFGGEASIKNTHLKFQPKWPALTGFDATIKFSPYRLNIVSDSIQLKSDLVATDVDVLIDHLETKDIAVNIKGKAAGSSESASAYLAETPLPDKLGVNDFLNDPEKLAMQGDVEVDLQEIWIPVYGYAEQDERVSGSVLFDNVQWKLFDQLTFSNIDGTLDFTEKGVSSPGLRSGFEGGTANIKISTDQSQKQIQIKVAGTAQPDYPGILKGPVDWDAAVKIPTNKTSSGVGIDINADTTKAEWLMPAPLNNETLGGKARASLMVRDGKVSVAGSVDRFGVFALNVKTDGPAMEIMDGAVKVGGGDTAAVVSEKNKMAVNGVLDQVDLDGWLKWKSGDSTSGSPEWLKSLVWAKSNLKAKSVLFFNQSYPEFDLTWQTVQKGQLAFNVSSDYALGVATLLNDEALDINVDRLRLNLPEDTFSQNTIDPEEAQRQLQQCKLKTPSLGTWPKVTFNGKGVVVNDIAIDQLNFQIEDNRNALHFKNLNAVFAKKAGVLSGQYFFHKMPKQSSAAIKVTSNDVKALTELLGLKQGFSGKNADLKANIAWSGGLECFDLLGLTGRTDFEIKNGVIEDVEPGFARLLGLLNVTSLARRLSLDMKDVTTKGMAYDSIKGKAIFNDGKMNLDGFKLQAPSAKVDLFGAVNLVERNFDLRADVTPALGSSLPALSALTGVATPLGALAIYALMKVIPDINEDLVTYKYDVTGPWTAPVIQEKNGDKVEKKSNEPDDILNQ
ncbi:YhdP family protein, partial [Thiomicrorhabdus sp.]|uniref:YhdP family phospholipid transporter n=1 Tax=Thiomicrorhabdus sp. TaxID=2039724 RepID=UPI00356A4D92